MRAPRSPRSLVASLVTAIALAAGLLVLFPGHAAAQCPCGAIRGTVQSAAQAMKAHMSMEVMATRVEVMEVIRQWGQHNAGTIESAKKARMKVAEQMREQDHLAERDTEKRKKAQNVLPAHRACVDATAGANLGSLGVTAAAVRKDIEASNLWYNTNNDPATARMDVGTTTNLIQRRRKMYCDPPSAARGLCELAADNEAEQFERANADIRAETLYRDHTLETESSLIWARDYARTVTRPVPPAPQPVGALNSPRGKLAQMERAKFDARISTAQQILEWQIGQRSEGRVDMEAWRQGAILGEGRQAIANGNRSAMTDEDPGKLSIEELDALQVRRRYANENWYAGVNAKGDPASVYKEMAFMKAQDLYRQYRRLQQAQRVAAAKAVRAASRADLAWHTSVVLRGPPSRATPDQAASAAP